MLRKLPTSFKLTENGRGKKRRGEGGESGTRSGANLAPLHTSCMTLDESLSLPEPVSFSAIQLTFPILQARRED